MICTILIPSRNNPTGLIAAVESVGVRDGVDFLIRVDDDDPVSTETALDLTRRFPVQVVIGPSPGGHSNLASVVDDLATKAKGDWITMLDDDARLLGLDWEKQLAKLPLEGVYVRTEFFEHGYSLYGPDHGPPGWFVPNQAWRKLGLTDIGNPVDEWMMKVFQQDAGWEPAWLKATTYKHFWAKGRWK